MSSMDPTRKPRVLLDTTVLVAGSAWPRWPHEVLLAGLRGEFTLVLSPYILHEARRILRARFPQHLGGFEQFLALAPVEMVADPTPAELTQYRGLVRDVADLPVALAGILAGVDYLVSEDKDLTAQDETTTDLRQRLVVLLPGTFLRQVLGWSSDRLESLRGRNWKELETLE